MLVPVEKHSGLKRPVNEQERAKLKKQREKAEYNRRNNKRWR